MTFCSLLLSDLNFFILGAIIGSFLNVCIYRLPIEKSVVSPRSFCPHCEAPIPWYLNIPLLSWIILRGRTACCKNRISLRYPLVEFLTGILYLALWKVWHAPIVLAYIVLVSLLIVGTFIDFKHFIIPDSITIGGMIIGIGFSWIFPELQGESNPFWSVIKSVQNACFGTGFLLWIAIIAENILKKEAMGMGDVKLMGCLGAFLGWQGCLFALFGGALIGTVIYLPIVLYGSILKYLLKKTPNFTLATVIPFGPFLSLASLAYVLGLHVWMNNYFLQIKTLLALLN